MFTVGKVTLSREAPKGFFFFFFIPSAAGHGNVLSSPAPLKPPAEKSQERLFVSALREDWGRWSVCQGWGAGGGCREAIIAQRPAFVTNDKLVNQK